MDSINELLKEFEPIICEDEFNENEVLTFTPKGLAWYALKQVGLLDNVAEGQFEAFWILFTNDMKKYGYVQEDEEQ